MIEDGGKPGLRSYLDSKSLSRPIRLPQRSRLRGNIAHEKGRMLILKLRWKCTRHCESTPHFLPRYLYDRVTFAASTINAVFRRKMRVYRVDFLSIVPKGVVELKKPRPALAT